MSDFASIDDWHAAVVTYLGTALNDVEVEGAEMEGVQRDRDVVAVWWPGWDELPRDTSLAQPTLSLRWFPARSKLPTTDEPANGQPLRQAADALLTAFDRASQVPGFFVDGLACRLTRLRPDYRADTWWLDGTLLAYSLGVAA